MDILSVYNKFFFFFDKPNKARAEHSDESHQYWIVANIL